MPPLAVEFFMPEWEPIVMRAAEALCAKGLPRPDDFGPGKYHLMRRTQRDGFTRYRLYYLDYASGRHVFIGRFLTSDVPPVSQRAKPDGIRPGHVFQVDTGAHVQVVVDHLGLPRVNWLGY